MEEGRGRSLAETPTYSVASVVTVMVFVCFLVERSIYRFGKVNNKTLISLYLYIHSWSWTLPSKTCHPFHYFPAS